METLTEERPPAPGVAASPPAPAARSKLLALLVAMRPQEWIKNLLVFAGLLFSGKLDEGAQVLDATAHLHRLLRDLERRLPVQRPP